jgi:hypothetical protein
MLDHPSANIGRTNHTATNDAAISVGAGLLALHRIRANELDEGLGGLQTTLISPVACHAGLLRFGASIPLRRTRVPRMSMVSPSITRATPLTAGLVGASACVIGAATGSRSLRFWKMMSAAATMATVVSTA